MAPSPPVLVVSLAVLLGSSLACREPAPSEAPRVEPVDANRAQTWTDVRAWAERESDAWLASDDVAARRQQWDRIAAAIAAEPDGERRSLMIAAQFLIGRSEPEAGLERREVADAALRELPLEDPRWGIVPQALAVAVWESGRWAELTPQLDALISDHPDPEVSAYLALERYAQTTAEGQAELAAAIWQRWLDRPALAATVVAPVMQSKAPTRVLAPGNPLPELCVEELDGGRLCTADLRGKPAVIEFWSTWCGGCREAVAHLRAAHDALGDDTLQFVSVDLYDDAATLRGFLASEPMPWRHGWVAEAEQEAVRARLQVASIPTLVLVDEHGTIVASSPLLRAENLLEQVRALPGHE